MLDMLEKRTCDDCAMRGSKKCEFINEFINSEKTLNVVWCSSFVPKQTKTEQTKPKRIEELLQRIDIQERKIAELEAELKYKDSIIAKQVIMLSKLESE